MSKDTNRVAASLERFAHLRPASQASASDDPHPTARAFAQDVLATAARARGERFDRTSMVQGPDQTRTRITGDDLVRALKKSGRAAKPGEGH